MTRKWLYLLRGGGEPHIAFADRVLGDLSSALEALDPARLKLTVTETHPPRSFFGFAKNPFALVSLWGSDPARVMPILEELGFSFSAYEVEESTPVMYERDWPDGEPTPSPILLTLLKKKPGLSDEEYIQRWHGGHTPLSLEVHPLWFYLRNVIVDRIKEDAHTWNGIVEEACATERDLLTPSRFFGGTLMMVPNMIRVWADIRRFLDVSEIEVYYATEYHLKSG